MVLVGGPFVVDRCPQRQYVPVLGKASSPERGLRLRRGHLTQHLQSSAYMRNDDTSRLLPKALEKGERPVRGTRTTKSNLPTLYM